MKRRLHRTKDQKIFLGILGGIAKYLRVDPTIVRLIFVLLCLFKPFFVILYFLLGIIMPDKPKNFEKNSFEGIKRRTSRILRETESSIQKILNINSKSIENRIKGKNNKNIRYIALGLIGLGLIIILNKTIFISYYILMREFIAVLLIIVGFYIFLKEVK